MMSVLSKVVGVISFNSRHVSWPGGWGSLEGGRSCFSMEKVYINAFIKSNQQEVPHKLLFFVRHTTVIGKTQSVIVCLGSFFMGVV